MPSSSQDAKNGTNQEFCVCVGSILVERLGVAVKPGQCLGGLEFFGHVPFTDTADVVAATDGMLAALTWAQLEPVVFSSPAFSHSFITYLGASAIQHTQPGETADGSSIIPQLIPNKAELDHREQKALETFYAQKVATQNEVKLLEAEHKIQGELSAAQHSKQHFKYLHDKATKKIEALEADVSEKQEKLTEVKEKLIPNFEKEISDLQHANDSATRLGIKAMQSLIKMYQAVDLLIHRAPRNLRASVSTMPAGLLPGASAASRPDTPASDRDGEGAANDKDDAPRRNPLPEGGGDSEGSVWKSVLALTTLQDEVRASFNLDTARINAVSVADTEKLLELFGVSKGENMGIKVPKSAMARKGSLGRKASVSGGSRKGSVAVRKRSVHVAMADGTRPTTPKSNAANSMADHAAAMAAATAEKEKADAAVAAAAASAAAAAAAAAAAPPPVRVEVSEVACQTEEEVRPTRQSFAASRDWRDEPSAGLPVERLRSNRFSLASREGLSPLPSMVEEGGGPAVPAEAASAPRMSLLGSGGLKMQARRSIADAGSARRSMERSPRVSIASSPADGRSSPVAPPSRGGVARSSILSQQGEKVQVNRQGVLESVPSPQAPWQLGPANPSAQSQTEWQLDISVGYDAVPRGDESTAASAAASPAGAIDRLRARGIDVGVQAEPYSIRITSVDLRTDRHARALLGPGPASSPAAAPPASSLDAAMGSSLDRMLDGEEEEDEGQSIPRRPPRPGQLAPELAMGLGEGAWPPPSPANGLLRGQRPVYEPPPPTAPLAIKSIHDPTRDIVPLIAGRSPRGAIMTGRPDVHRILDSSSTRPLPARLPPFPAPRDGGFSLTVGADRGAAWLSSTSGAGPLTLPGGTRNAPTSPRAPTAPSSPRGSEYL